MLHLFWRFRLLIVIAFVTGFYALEFLAPNIPEARAAYSISNSARFNDDDTAYLNRTPSSAGDRKTFTWSGWVKRGNLGLSAYFFSAGSASTDYTAIFFNSSDQLEVIRVISSATDARKVTSAVYRDPTKWHHIVVKMDAANTNLDVYVDGSEVTAFGTSDEPSNINGAENNNVLHEIGRRSFTPSGTYFDGYMADVYLVDGQALTPSSFGETDSNGYWRPKSYTGTYGTNGFKLDFAGGSDLGNDVSGNGNDWTQNNLNVMDQMVDTPTNSFATLNPVDNPTDCVRDGNCASPGVVLTSDGNLKWVGSGTAFEYRLWGATHEAPADNRYYFEARVDGEGTVDGDGHGFTVAGCSYSSTNFVSGDYLGFAIGTSSIYVRKNGTWQNSASESDVVNGNATNRCAARSGGRISNLGDASATADSYISATVVFGQTANPTSTATTLTYDSAAAGYFQYTAPSGYKALSTGNFPTPTITIPKQYFDAKIYSGTGAAQSITGLSFQPSLLWVKDRSSAHSHGIFDSTREARNFLSSDLAAAESVPTSTLTSFDSAGFTLGDSWTANKSSDNYISWLWKESVTAGFDVVSYAGDSTSNRNVSHSLGAAPEFAIVKRRDASGNWYAWHTSLSGATSFVQLNSTTSQSTTNSPWGTGNFSSTQFMVTNNTTNNLNATTTNASSVTYFSTDVGVQSAPSGIFFKSDGTKMYVVGSTDVDVFQYSLASPWDVSTATYDSVSKSVSAQDTAPRGIFFKSDGTKMYIVGDTGNAVYQYSLSTAWDLSTASYDSVSLSVATQDTAPQQIFFKSDGTKMYISGSTNDSVYQYSLSSAWDLSTATYDSVSKSVGAEDTVPRGISFKSDGTKMYLAGTTNDTIFQYSLSSAWDLSTATYDSVSKNVSAQDSNPTGIFFRSDGMRMYVSGSASNRIYQYDLSSAWANVSTASYNTPNSKSVSAETTGPNGIFFKSDGTKMFVVGDGNQDVFQYSLSSAWDIPTAIYDSVSTTTLAEDTAPNGIFFKSDGTKMYIAGNANNKIYQYSLSSAWNISTVAYDSVSTSTAAQETSPTDVAFKSDGTKMYVVGSASDAVFQYSLSSAWDISTASYDAVSKSVSAQDTTPSGIEFKSDGTKMYISGSTGDTIEQYSLSSAWDLSTATWDSVSKSIEAQDTVPSDVFFKSDGTKMFMIGSSNDAVHQYVVSSAWDFAAGIYIAYLWDEIAGFSDFGSYTGNGNADGPFVWTGFKPRYVMVKRTDATSDWTMLDTARSTYNVASATSTANTALAEGSNTSLDFLSNGFKVRSAQGAYNTSSGTYIYAAFAEIPFKYSAASSSASTASNSANLFLGMSF